MVPPLAGRRPAVQGSAAASRGALRFIIPIIDSSASILELGGVRAGAPNYTIVELDDPLDFFKSDVADVLFTSAEEGSAYTLTYPRYEMISPELPYPQLYLAYPVRKRELEWIGYLNNWLILEKDAGLHEAEYDYWVTGKTAVEKKPRWSVVRNVLHWVK